MPSKRITRRHQLVAQFGGKCQQCGYDRCLRALQFHHVDASEKSEWSGVRGNASNAEVAAHPERFELLCANCHFERHDAIDSASGHYRTCTQCGSEFRSTPNREEVDRGKYCSRRCMAESFKTKPGETTADRFHALTTREDECWIWNGYCRETNPTMVVKHSDGRHVPRSARRVAWDIYRPTPVPHALTVTCGNHRCVNPDHLRAR